MTEVRQPDCQLLNAAGAAYTIVPDTPWQVPTCSPTDPNGCLYDNVGYSDTPVPVVAGALGTDAALVGTAPIEVDGEPSTGVIVAFRGTLPPGGGAPEWSVIYDWLVNDVAGSDTVAIDGFGTDAAVHEGFWNATCDLFDGVVAAIRQVAGGQSLPLFVTGHSKGGPLATLTAAKIIQAHAAGDLTDIALPTVVTFASPHPGNAAFATGFDGVLTQRRWEYAYDLVPTVPPIPEVANDLGGIIGKVPIIGKLLSDLFGDIAHLDYAPVGQLYYVDTKGNLDPFSLGELERLIFDIGPEVAKNGLASLGAAHCHGCPDGPADTKTTTCDGGYMTGTCGASCC